MSLSTVRPHTYRKPGFWLDVLRIYRINGYSPREIANLLNDSLLIIKKLFEEGRKIKVIAGNPPDCEIIPALPKGHPIKAELNWHNATDRLSPVVAILSKEPCYVLRFWWDNDCWWTPRQVIYHIKQQEEIGSLIDTHARYKSIRRQHRKLKAIMEELREAEVAKLGWDHMLPEDRGHGIREDREVQQSWQGEKINLKRREARVLSALYENGPMTYYEIMAKLGYKPDRCHCSHILKNLLQIGAVIITGGKRRKKVGHQARLYSIVPGLVPHMRVLKIDKTDRIEIQLSQNMGKSRRNDLLYIRDDENNED